MTSDRGGAYNIMVGVTVTDAMPIGVLRALTEGDLDRDWAAGAALETMSGRGGPGLCR